MKKNQIILGASAFVLAIAGAFSTKASNKVAFTNAFTLSGSSCATSISTSCLTTNAGAICKTSSFNTNSIVTVHCVNRFKTVKH